MVRRTTQKQELRRLSRLQRTKVRTISKPTPIPTPKEIPIEDKQYEIDWYVASKMAITGKGEAGVTPRQQKFYNVIMGKVQPEVSGLTPAEQQFAKQIQREVQTGYTQKQEYLLKAKQLQAIKKPVYVAPDILTQAGVPTGDIQKIVSEKTREELLLFPTKERKVYTTALYFKDIPKGSVFLKPSEVSFIEPAIKKGVPVEVSALGESYIPVAEPTYLQRVSRATFKEIAKSEHPEKIPALVTKPFLEAGKFIVEDVEKGQKLLWGEKYVGMTPQEKETWGIGIGTLGLFGFFSPVFTTGTTAQQKAIAKQLSKGKFESLTKALGSLEKKVAEKTTIGSQLKYLKSIKSQLTTQEQINAFNKWVQQLIDKQIIKPVTIDLTTTQTQTQQLYIEITGQIPTMKGAGVIGGVVSQVKPISKDIFLQPMKQTPFQVDKVKQTQWLKQPQLLGMTSILGQKQIPKAKQKLKQKEITKQAQPQLFRTTQLTQQRYRQRTAQRTQQLFRQRYRQRQQPRLKQRFGKDILIPLPEKTLISKKEGKITKKGKLYKIYVKRFGEDILIGTGRTLQEAQKKLKGILKTTLRASGFVLEKGKRVKLDLFGKEFRPAKREPLRVVQKRKYRLGTRSEVKEIQFFRKQRGKKKSLW